MSRILKRNWGPVAAAVLFASLFWWVQSARSVASYYVSATGSGTVCSFLNPCTLTYAMNTKQYVPGDTIWVRGGTYVKSGNSFLFGGALNQNGTAANPIIFRNYNNEHVIIDCSRNNEDNQCLGTFNAGGAYTWFWGFDIQNTSAVSRQNTTGNNSPPVGSESYRQDGITPLADGSRVINNIIRDKADCVFTSSNYGSGKEIYGNLCQNTGYQALDREHGHSHYIQNPIAPGEAGRTLVQDNISVRIGERGIHSYGASGQVAYVTYDHNVEAGTGLGGSYTTNPNAIWPVDGNDSPVHYGTNGTVSQSCAGSDKIAYNPILNGNYTYGAGPAFVMGFDKGSCNATLTNNFFANTSSGNFTSGAGNCAAVGVQNPCGTYGTLTITGNTFMAAPDGSGGDGTGSLTANRFTQANFPSNTYLSTWPTTGTDKFYRPNKYEPGRGFAVVYNWTLASTVTIDLAQMGGFPGEAYKVFNYQDADFWNSTPIATGTCPGGGCGSITVNTTGVVPIRPNGLRADGQIMPRPAETGPRFNTYILIPDWGSGVSTPTATLTNTFTNTPTNTATTTPSPTLTPIPATATPTLTPIPQTSTPTITVTNTPTATPTPSFNGRSFSVNSGGCATVAPMALTADSGLNNFGGYYISATGGSVGSTTCSFDPAPNVGQPFRVWVLLQAQTPQADSMFVTLNGETKSTHIFDMGENVDCTTGAYEQAWGNSYRWVIWKDRLQNCGASGVPGLERAQSVGGAIGSILPAGLNTIKFEGREDGARIAYVIFTDDFTYDPNSPVPSPTVTNTPSFTPTGSNTPTSTATPTGTLPPTDTPTLTPSITPTFTQTNLPTRTPLPGGDCKRWWICHGKAYQACNRRPCP